MTDQAKGLPLNELTAELVMRGARDQVAVMRHQLRNIEHVLVNLVERWNKEADALDDEGRRQKLARTGQWDQLTADSATAAERRARAADLKRYVDTWTQP